MEDVISKLDLRDISGVCGTFVDKEGRPRRDEKYGTFTSDNGKELKGTFYFIDNSKKEGALFASKEKYTGYVSDNPNYRGNGKEPSFLKQIHGILYYPNGDAYIGCFFDNEQDGKGKYYRYMGLIDGKKKYKLVFDGDWKEGRYVLKTPPTLNKQAFDVWYKDGYKVPNPNYNVNEDGEILLELEKYPTIFGPIMTDVLGQNGLTELNCKLPETDAFIPNHKPY